MNKKEILVIGRNEDILPTVLRLVNNNPDWNGTGAVTDEEAIEKFHGRLFDIVLLTNGISDQEEAKLRRVFTHQHPDVIIIQHYGGGSGLLTNEILEALDRKQEENRPAISITDDALKNAKTTIQFQ